MDGKNFFVFSTLNDSKKGYYCKFTTKSKSILEGPRLEKDFGIFCSVSLHSPVTACEGLGYRSNALPMGYRRVFTFAEKELSELFSLRLFRKIFAYIQKFTFKNLNYKPESVAQDIEDGSFVLVLRINVTSGNIL